MKTAIAEFGHVLEPGNVGTVADADHGDGDAFGRQGFDEFGDPFFLFGVGAVGQDDDVFDLVAALGEGVGGCFEAGADVDAASSSAYLANLVDD
jgi:hypothetical protein